MTVVVFDLCGSRLFSSQVYQDLEDFSRPEIVDKPADQLVLHLKSMNIVKVYSSSYIV